METELQISFFLRTEAGQHWFQTLPNLVLKAPQLTTPMAGPHLYWYQSCTEEISWQGRLDKCILGEPGWHSHQPRPLTLTPRNSGQEPTVYLVKTVEFPTRCSLCQEKRLEVTPWDILNLVLLMGMRWHSLHPSSFYISESQWNEASWVTPKHPALSSRMYIFDREMSKLFLSISRKDFWHSLLLFMLQIKRKSVARMGRELQGPISYIPLSLGCFPTPSPCLFPHSH